MFCSVEQSLDDEPFSVDTFCGSDGPDIILSDVTGVKIEFETDWSVNREGFQIKYRLTNSEADEGMFPCLSCPTSF